jgi:hypothetical protein
MGDSEELAILAESGNGDNRNADHIAPVCGFSKARRAEYDDKSHFPTRLYDVIC